MADWLKRQGMTGRKVLDLPPVWLLGFLVAVRVLVRLWPATEIRHPVAQTFGAVWVLSGLVLMVLAVHQFRVHATSVVPHQIPERLITAGVFARTRNPIYLGDTLVLAGAILWWGVWPALLLVPLFMTVITRRFILPEEARMRGKFKGTFTEYIQNTPRWI